MMLYSEMLTASLSIINAGFTTQKCSCFFQSRNDICETFPLDARTDCMIDQVFWDVMLFWVCDPKHF